MVMLKLFAPAFFAAGMGILLAFHPIICVGITCGSLFLYAIVHSIYAAQMIQEQFERNAKSPPRVVQSIEVKANSESRELMIRPTNRDVVVRVVDQMLKKTG